MQLSDQEYFRELKKEVSATFRGLFPSSPVEIEEWKGQDIVNFQEELMQKVNGRISEKWFYTHIKGQQEKLPRIDMLNLLSEYAGYRSWSDFVMQKKGREEAPGTGKLEIPTAEKHEAQGILESASSQPAAESLISGSNSSKRVLIIIAVLLVLSSITVIAILNRPHIKTYQCCFVDMDGRAPIPNARIELKVLSYNESPVLAEVDSNGCFELKTTDDKVRLVVTSPYYRADSVTRVLTSDLVYERVKLRTNDYALMIHYFSTSKVSDWKKRRMQLDDMIAENAKIFQVYDDNSGMELYNKDEFINKLTMPLKSLRNIEIIETQYTGNKISELRFRQKE
jgi:hypothetical protein